MTDESILELLREKDKELDFYKQENLELKKTISNYISFLGNIQHELTIEEINLGNITFDNTPRFDEDVVKISMREYRSKQALEKCFEKLKEHLKEILSIKA